ncbi:hypothetical protein BCER1_46950 [Bacillus cereus]|nr:hypothetical protein BCER1_46950 [Bacillus cereus]
MGSKKRKKKQAKRQKYIKKKTGAEHTFFTKSSHYNRENISVYLYVLVCDFLCVFMWDG